MNSRWNETEAARFAADPVALRAYTSRLLGAEPSLVQHGGGNTSVKVFHKNIFGEKEHLLYVKGSGWDLATIAPQGFAPVKMETLLRLSRLEHLSDTDMVREQRSAMTDPSAPTPSVEAILHALIPFDFVEHTHADAVVTLTNTPSGVATIRELFGPRVLVVPYVMPGFILAREILRLTSDVKWHELDGMILLNHGVFTFHNDAKTAYENMLRLVTKAEQHLAGVSLEKSPSTSAAPTALQLATLRKGLSVTMGRPVLLRLNASMEAVAFANWEKAAEVTARGTVTPDHVIHIKPWPMVLGSPDFASEIENYTQDYHAYFSSHATDDLKELDACPRWIVWPGHGCLSVGTSSKNLRVIDDITTHTRRCMLWAEALGGWKPVSEADLFAVEYWELEQAKLKVGAKSAALQGKIAVVTGGASGIGLAVVEELAAQGAAVAVLDIDPSVVTKFSGDGRLGVVCDVTKSESVMEAFRSVAAHFGGLDILVTNAGSFPSGRPIDELAESEWLGVLDVNLSGHWRVIRAAIPFLKLGFDPSVVVIGSKNVAAPGPGAAAYSAAKAGLTQLARVAALELAPFGVRVNIVHPDAVFDTGIWTPEVLSNRAKHYGLTVDQYKRKNLLKTEVTSKNVAQLAAALVGPAFSKTTGAQIPIDGGNDRVI